MVLRLLHGVDRTNFHASAALYALGRINDRFLVNHADGVDYTYTHAFGTAVAAQRINFQKGACRTHVAPEERDRREQGN
jgi:hypothetical protein